MIFANYTPEHHKAGCLAAFDSNVPHYFDTSERQDFETFLDQEAGDYVVMLEDNKVIGCGGVALNNDEAVLCWGLLHADWHGRGLGRALLEQRLKMAEAMPQARRIVCATSQHTEAFYAKKGFITQRRINDGWAPGLHRIEMVKPINRA